MCVLLGAVLFALYTLLISAAATRSNSYSSAAIFQFDAIDNSANHKIGLLISIEANKSDQDEVNIVAIGPVDRDYFAIGFGSHQMHNTYTMVFYANGRVEEYMLSSQSRHRKAQKLRKSIKVEYMEQEYNTLSMVITRKARGVTDKHYTFDRDLLQHEPLDIIYAMSPYQHDHSLNSDHSDANKRKLKLHYHGRYKGEDTLFFELSTENETDSLPYGFIDAFVDEIGDEYLSSNDSESAEGVPMMAGMSGRQQENSLSTINHPTHLSATQSGLLAATVVVFLCMTVVLVFLGKHCNQKHNASVRSVKKSALGRDISPSDRCSLSPINAVITEVDASELWLDVNEDAHDNQCDEASVEAVLNRVISEEHVMPLGRSRTRELLPARGADDEDNSDNAEEEVLSDRSDAGSVQM